MEFRGHVVGYAIYHQCPPCPIGDWLHPDSYVWLIDSPGQDTGSPAQHALDRILLYANAMTHGSDHSSIPTASIYCALRGESDPESYLNVAETIRDCSKATEELLRGIRMTAS